MSLVFSGCTEWI